MEVWGTKESSCRVETEAGGASAVSNCSIPTTSRTLSYSLKLDLTQSRNSQKSKRKFDDFTHCTLTLLHGNNFRHIYISRNEPNV